MRLAADGGAPTDIGSALLRAREAMERGARAEALRWADRAQRRCPASPEIAELKARLLAGLGAPADALEELLKIEPAAMGAAGHALVAQVHLELGRVEEALAALQSALVRFAVEPGDPLAACARAATVTLGGEAAPGWIGLDQRLRPWGETGAGPAGRGLAAALDGQALQVSSATGERPSGSFTIADDLTGRAGVITATLRGRPLLGHGLAFPPDFDLDGRCWAADGSVEGWVRVGWSPGAPADLVIRDDDRIVGRRPAADEPDEAGRRRFSIAVPRKSRSGSLAVEVLLPGGRSAPLPTSPALTVVPPAPKGSRGGWDVWNRRPPHRDRPVDIVIPVFQGREETIDCLRSVLGSGVEPSRVIVVNDASPDPALAADLRIFAAEGVILLENAENLGFPASVNRGLRLNPGHDAVVLNADAEVYPGWFERLRDAAYSSPDIGTVTPLSNAGAIASYPLRDMQAPSCETATEIDRLAAVVNAGERVETPTGVGFCLYVRRDCLDEVGALDARAFGRGYGEENDFCLRAGERGWRHLIATDVFVRHRQSRSFGRDGAALRERNGRVLSRRHPRYDALVEDFMRRDPLRPARRRLDEGRLKALGGPTHLLVSLTNPGGVDRVIEQRCRGMEEAGGVSIVLRPEPARLRLSVYGQPFDDLIYAIAGEEREALLGLLRGLRPVQVELHHFLDHDSGLIEDILSLGQATTAFIHDYSWICPRLTLLGGSGRYCGEPELDGCAACVAANGALLGEDISTAELRARSLRWLTLAERVIAPSRDARARLERYFPGLAIDVEPWESETFEPVLAKTRPGRPVKVAVIGAIGEQKGYKVLVDCVRDAAERLLPMEFVVVGFTVDDEAWLSLGATFVTGRFHEDDVAALIRREAPDVALLASVTPETHCFCLTHALRARLPVVAFDIGAVAERLRDAGARASLLPIEAEASAINTALLTLARDTHGGALRPRPRLSRETGDAPSLMNRQGRLVAGIDRRPSGGATMPDATTGITADPRVLVLGRGLFSFSVKSASPRCVDQDANLVLPALHVALAPGVPAHNIEIVTGMRAEGGWLYEVSDVLIMKVKVAGSAMLITSYAAAGLTPLAVEIEQLDAPREAELPARTAGVRFGVYRQEAG